jgi:hypothetical protein
MRTLVEFTLDTIFTLPKHCGRSLRYVAKFDPSYVYWCIRTIDYFYVSDETLEEIKKINRHFKLIVRHREEVKVAMAEKRQRWISELILTDIEEREAESDKLYGRTKVTDDELQTGDWEYDPLNPAHNPDENPWIAEFGAGDEAETAYWNTD